MMKRLLQTLVVFATILALGCSGGGNPNLPKTYKVTGTVTLNGTPVDGATVSFHPIDGTVSSIGLTDASGQYALSTFSPSDGAPAGQYNVSIVKHEGASLSAAAPAGQIASGEIDVASYEPPMETGGERIAARSGPKSLLPVRYANAQTSALRATVTEGANNTVDFPLK